MIVGIGTDLVSIDRIERAITRHGDAFLNRIFSERERTLCQSRTPTAACFAKRFAAKEAVSKALGFGFRDGIWFTDMEVLPDPWGKPAIHMGGESRRYLNGLQNIRIHLSLSDDQGFAQAFVVIERLSEPVHTP
jgi:holo-[acyl-carrier protein] synthase